MDTNKVRIDKIANEQADLKDSVENIAILQEVVVKAMLIIRKAQEKNDKIVEEMGELIKVMGDEISELKNKKGE